MSRIALDKIPALTFYKNALTKARRTSAIAQLVCVGKPCALYQPEVVRCTNIGGSGTDVDWQCEADLPSSLRFGKVEVSCEGWNGPGDPYVMKGSCSLEYQLVQLPGALRDDTPRAPSPLAIPRFLREMDASGVVFMLVWLAVLALLAYTFATSCMRLFHSRPHGGARRPAHRSTGSSSGGGGGGGGDGGAFPFTPSSPPPPYSKDPPTGGEQQWRPGFWSGAALGAFAHSLLNRDPDPDRAASFMGGGSARRRPAPGFGSYDDRGEGPSSLGAMRTSTGYGESRSR